MFRTKRFHRLFKEGFWIVIGQAMAVLGSLVGVRVLTQMLNPAAYGELALGMTVATLVNQTVFGPLGNGITRFYAPAQEQGDIAGYLKAARRLVLMATGIVASMILVTAISLAAFRLDAWIAMAVAALIFATLSGYNAILSGIQNAARQRSVVALHQGMESWLRILLAAGLILWLGAISAVAMLGYMLALIFVICSQYLFFKTILNKESVGENKASNWQEKIWRFSWPFATWGVFYWAQSASDRWALGLFATANEVGLYAVLFQLGYAPMAMATGMAMQFLTPIVYKQAGDASDSQRIENVSKVSWRLTGITLALTCLVCVLALLLHKQIFLMLVAKDYVSVSYLLPWVMLASGLFSSGQIMGLNLLSQMKPHLLMRMTIMTSSLGVVFNFIGAYFYNIPGVVFANLAFSSLYAVWLVALSRRKLATSV